MGKGFDESRLFGDWIHADEEDSADRLVLRTARYPFQPRRMPRSGLTLKPGGVAELGSPGPADANVNAAGNWTLEENQLSITGAGLLSGRFQIVAVDDESLVLRRLQ